jgi:hypothetical protein
VREIEKITSTIGGTKGVARDHSLRKKRSRKRHKRKNGEKGEKRKERKRRRRERGPFPMI